MKTPVQMFDDSPFCVWKSSDGNASLLSMPNGLVLRRGERTYRVGIGDGPREDGTYPVILGSVNGGDIKELL